MLRGWACAILLFSLLLLRSFCFHQRGSLYFPVARFLLNLRSCVYFFLLLLRSFCFHRRGSLYFSVARYPRGGYFCRVSQNGTYKSRKKQGLLRPVFTVTALKMLVMEKNHYCAFCLVTAKTEHKIRSLIRLLYACQKDVLSSRRKKE